MFLVQSKAVFASVCCKNVTLKKLLKVFLEVLRDVYLSLGKF